MKAVRFVMVAMLLLGLLAGAAAPRVQATADQRASSKGIAPTIGISYRLRGGTLAWFDPVSLRPLPGRKAPLAGHVDSWAFSSDRSVVALSSCAAESLPGIRFVNARAMRVLGTMRLSPYGGCVSALSWLRPDRLLAVSTANASDQRQLVVVDPVARRVVRRAELSAYPAATRRMDTRLVLLLDSVGAFAPARLAVVDPEGAIRTVSVDRVLQGTVVDQASSDYRSRTLRPGLAVDREGGRAFLVPSSGPVAEIDLDSLAVTYHELERPSLLGHLWRWLFPAAEAKLMEGPVREARWLGGGMIAVSGQDYALTSDGSGAPTMRVTPAGLSLIDTRTWEVRVLDREASGFAAAAGLVVAEGGRWDSGQDRGFGPGLRAFDLDGHERWRLHEGQYRWLNPAGVVGYVYLDEYPGGARVEVVDIASGTILATLRRDGAIEAWPQLLAEQFSDW